MTGHSANDMATKASDHIVDANKMVGAAQGVVAYRLEVQTEGVEPFTQYVTDHAFVATLRNAGCQVNATALYETAPVTAAPVDAPSAEAAHAMGSQGGPANDAERLAFEAWMRGHCWALCATWDGAGYRSDAEQGGGYCPDAARTRMLWAAWRDRAALAAA